MKQESKRDLIRERRDFVARLLSWYDQNRRDLPWRRAPTPYTVLVSEVMLQQTRAETVIPYFRRFLRRFPDLRSLARADDAEVLKAWEGLGYYRRARNLLETARALRGHAFELPSSAMALRALPGIGPYTAAAVASIAFGEPEPVVDGNVERVLSRLLAREEPPSRERAVLRGLLSSVIPERRPGDFNQALMELGATVCAPRVPACDRCPVRAFCRVDSSGNARSYPRRLPPRTVPVRRECAIIVRVRRRLLLRKRPDEGLLGGLWGLPSYPLTPSRTLDRFRRDSGLAVQVEATFASLRHDYSHFSLFLTPLLCSPGKQRVSNRPATADPDAAGDRTGRGELHWVKEVDVPALPMSGVDRRTLASVGVGRPSRAPRLRSTSW